MLLCTEVKASYACLRSLTSFQQKADRHVCAGRLPPTILLWRDSWLVTSWVIVSRHPDTCVAHEWIDWMTKCMRVCCMYVNTHTCMYVYIYLCTYVHVLKHTLQPLGTTNTFDHDMMAVPLTIIWWPYLWPSYDSSTFFMILRHWTWATICPNSDLAANNIALWLTLYPWFFALQCRCSFHERALQALPMATSRSKVCYQGCSSFVLIVA
jgi:hypothetical protein